MQHFPCLGGFTLNFEERRYITKLLHVTIFANIHSLHKSTRRLKLYFWPKNHITKHSTKIPVPKSKCNVASVISGLVVALIRFWPFQFFIFYYFDPTYLELTAKLAGVEDMRWDVLQVSYRDFFVNSQTSGVFHNGSKRWGTLRQLI